MLVLFAPCKELANLDHSQWRWITTRPFLGTMPAEIQFAMGDRITCKAWQYDDNMETRQSVALTEGFAVLCANSGDDRQQQLVTKDVCGIPCAPKTRLNDSHIHLHRADLVDMKLCLPTQNTNALKAPMEQSCILKT